MTQQRSAFAGYLLIVGASILVSLAHLMFKLCTTWAYPVAVAVAGTIALFCSGLMAARAYRDGTLTVLYPLLFFSQIWNPILATVVLSEPVSLGNWAGVLLIVAGAAIVVW